jgi:hypothetical protein
MRLFAALLMLGGSASIAIAGNPCTSARERLAVGNGVYTGADLNELPDRDVIEYAAGFVDAFSTSMIIGASEECFRKIRWCVEGRTNAQFGAMVRKYLRENPADWHSSGGLIVYHAVFADCLK